MTLGWALIFAFASFLNPVCIAVGIAVGLIARRRWHLTGAIPIMIFLLWALGGRDGLNIMAPFAAAASLLWAAIAFKAKALLTG